jgi:hypothetical protein
MKKVFKSLLLIALLTGSISATPCCYIHCAKDKNITDLTASTFPEQKRKHVEVTDIHPMNILSLKFN